MKYKLIVGLLKEDQEQYPDMKKFDDEINLAVKECYVIIHNTFRVTAIAGNILYSVICELSDTPNFIGGGTGGTGFKHEM